MIRPPVGQIVPHPIEHARGDWLGRNRADNPAHSNGTRDEAIRDRKGAAGYPSSAGTPLPAVGTPSKLDGWRGQRLFPQQNNGGDSTR